MKSRQVVGWVAAGMTLALLSAVVAGYVLARPYPVGVGPLPADLAGRKIEFPGAEGATLRGWFVPSHAHRGTILLMHGVRSNRRQMLDRAQFLHRAGYSVLLFDSRAHGESGGNAITFGYLESRDARSEEHTSELQSRFGISYAVFCLKKTKHDYLAENDTHQATDSQTTLSQFSH